MASPSFSGFYSTQVIESKFGKKKVTKKIKYQYLPVTAKALVCKKMINLKNSRN